MKQGIARGGEFAVSGIPLVMQGLIKKLALADVIAAHIVDPAFAHPDAYSPIFLAIGLLAYSIQIYLDLSGYTDMARGVSRFFGYELPINFNRPYLAGSVSNFWQRWHITMSSFFRDYLFFGVGGSRKGNVYLNLLITFVAIGLWHGAGWNFVVYGFIHGSMVGLERWLRNRRKRDGVSEVYRGQLVASLPLSIGITFLFVMTSRVLFRGESLGAAAGYLAAMGNWDRIAEIPLGPLGVSALLAGIMLHFTPLSWRDAFAFQVSRAPAPVVALSFAALIVLFIALAEGGTSFIYFQF